MLEARARPDPRFSRGNPVSGQREARPAESVPLEALATLPGGRIPQGFFRPRVFRRPRPGSLSLPVPSPAFRRPGRCRRMPCPPFSARAGRRGFPAARRACAAVSSRVGARRGDGGLPDAMDRRRRTARFPGQRARAPARRVPRLLFMRLADRTVVADAPRTAGRPSERGESSRHARTPQLPRGAGTSPEATRVPRRAAGTGGLIGMPKSG